MPRSLGKLELQIRAKVCSPRQNRIDRARVTWLVLSSRGRDEATEGDEAMTVVGGRHQRESGCIGVLLLSAVSEANQRTTELSGALSWESVTLAQRRELCWLDCARVPLDWAEWACACVCVCVSVVCWCSAVGTALTVELLSRHVTNLHQSNVNDSGCELQRFDNNLCFSLAFSRMSRVSHDTVLFSAK